MDVFARPELQLLKVEYFCPSLPFGGDGQKIPTPDSGKSMTKQIIINTSGEEQALIPDKWVLGTGLSTDGLYVVHTSAPFMIVQYPLAAEESGNDNQPCTVYTNGKINPESFNRLFAEAWKIVEIYRERLNMLSSGFKKL